MGLNVSALRRDGQPHQSRMTKFLRSLVIASSIATGGATALSVPDDIRVVKQLTSKPPNPVLTDRHSNLMVAKLISLLMLGGSFGCWRQSLADDEREWMKKFSTT